MGGGTDTEDDSSNDIAWAKGMRKPPWSCRQVIVTQNGCAPQACETQPIAFRTSSQGRGRETWLFHCLFQMMLLFLSLLFQYLSLIPISILLFCNFCDYIWLLFPKRVLAINI